MYGSSVAFIFMRQFTFDSVDQMLNLSDNFKLYNFLRKATLQDNITESAIDDQSDNIMLYYERK